LLNLVVDFFSATGVAFFVLLTTFSIVYSLCRTTNLTILILIPNPWFLIAKSYSISLFLRLQP
jgi:hypothetical protein